MVIIKVIAGIVLFLFLSQVADARESESAVKAAFLYKFCFYVTWPDSAFENAFSPIIIGVSGKKQFIDKLSETVNGRSLSGRNFVIRKIDSNASLADLHVLYIAEKSTFLSEHPQDIFTKVPKDKPLLIVNDSEVSSSETIIRFIEQENRIRFAVSRTQAEAVGLKISSQLLALALRVD